MKPKVSIIIPVFNVERFLRKSLHSIINQTFKKIEIIIINDGSTDDSLKICQEFERKDPRIKVIDQQNQGVSGARNEGLKIATGEYIGFIDPDDWIEPTMFEQMYNSIISNNADLTICDYFIEAGKDTELKSLKIDKNILQKHEIRDLIIENMIGADHLFKQNEVIMGSVCRLLIKRSNLEKWEIKFKRDLALMEDLIFCIEYLIQTEKISIVNKPLYHYVKNISSAVNSYRENKENELKNVFKILKDILESEKLYSSFVNKMRIRYIRIYLLSITNESNVGNPKKTNEKVKTIKRYCNNKIMRRYLNEIDTRNYSFKHKVLLFLINKKYATIIYLYYMYVNKKKTRALN